MDTLNKISKLQHFRQLAGLGTQHLQEIAEQAEWLTAIKGDLIIDLGSEEECSFFLLEGTVSLTAADGREQFINHDDESAKSPLSGLRPSRYLVKAAGAVTYLKLAANCLCSEQDSVDTFSNLNSSQYVVNESTLDDSDPQTRLLVSIYGDLNQNKLRILSWYPVSRKVCDLLLKETHDREKVAQLLALDPGLAVKVLRASAHVAIDLKPAATLSAAVANLGLPVVQKMAFLNLFTETTNPSDKNMALAYKHHWERSITVSTLSRRLAKNADHKHAGDSSIAGLFYALGELVILSYAQNSLAPIDSQSIKTAIAQYGAEISKVVLSHWWLPIEIIEAVTRSENWLHTQVPSTPMVDIVTLARAYAELTLKEESNVPRISQMPAFGRLHLNKTGGETMTASLKDIAENTVEDTWDKLNAVD